MNHSDCMTPMWNVTLHQVTCTVLAWGVSVLSFLPCHTCILSNYLIVIHNSSSQTPDIKIKMEERPDSSVLTKNKCNEEANNQSVIDSALCPILDKKIFFVPFSWGAIGSVLKCVHNHSKASKLRKTGLEVK